MKTEMSDFMARKNEVKVRLWPSPHDRIKSLLLFICVLFPLVTFGQDKKWTKGESIVKEHIWFISPGGFTFYPFMDEESGLIGFVRANSNLPVQVPPTYEDLYNNGEFLLVAVKKGGKWGAVDLADRWFTDDYHAPDPIIPCIYDEVRIIDNSHARVVKNGKSMVVDVSEGKYTYREYYNPTAVSERARKKAKTGE